MHDTQAGTSRLDKTFGEIKEALLAGKSVIVDGGGAVYPIILEDDIEESASGVISVIRIGVNIVAYENYTVTAYSEYPETMPK